MKKNIFWEMILILATIPVFRSLWIFLDSIEWMDKPAWIFISFIIGLILSVLSLVMINKKT